MCLVRVSKIIWNLILLCPQAEIGIHVGAQMTTVEDA